MVIIAPPIYSSRNLSKSSSYNLFNISYLIL
nr:MAG TPA: hypothetical protein [Crassvirales sp.]